MHNQAIQSPAVPREHVQLLVRVQMPHRARLIRRGRVEELLFWLRRKRTNEASMTEKSGQLVHGAKIPSADQLIGTAREQAQAADAECPSLLPSDDDVNVVDEGTVSIV
eukprot:CAMPEP_0115835398 /NCGR_PEP_ID=MMETSP0287-20121206/4173_1 /TAXON_ID=412157 /ORGANISM="Chrysochromulina rotalis, Strain UIO044" /LENGTH=108 /DNA_ID=CAMNT_0003288853 /DNA_START=719 /DNA_END=1046 /DNA_ORIENTATION=-